MTKKDIETKDSSTAEEITSTETETKVETKEDKASKDKGMYLRIGAVAMFVGVSTLILGSIWSNNSATITAFFDNSPDTSITADATDKTTTVEIIVDSAIEETITPATTSIVTKTISNKMTPSFEEMKKNQLDRLTKNLQKQREMMQAAFAKADQQRQKMHKFSSESQTAHMVTFKQDPMAEIMQNHRIEVMKIMEERRQKFIKEMNQSYTSKS